ncbi:hybrid sensor histidine kinase/response regulator transcription factor [Sinomicrobium soli]|uniref:hybrid sensor histidine kinase/response regulator transcription factor n=1 Tax=Sinomicrobium sp. N-1-3-6 TaxID=2219864 RepID=UPI001374CE76|nr:hybrid sensor histidine kinase/response regulator transcription factor [Sinomicrobium sp. N-1-3-6]
MKRIFLIGSLFLFYGLLPLRGQSVKNSFSLSELDGLPQNKVKAIAKDQYGYLWIGTQNSITRYDGINFRNYNDLDGKDINKILVDDKNRVWIGSGEGIYVLDRVKGTFRNIFGGNVKDIIGIDGGAIYFITPSHLYKVNPDYTTTAFQTDFRGNLRKMAYYGEHFFLGLGNQLGLRIFKPEPGKLVETRRVLQGQVINCLEVIRNEVLAATPGGRIFRYGPDGLSEIDLPNTYPIKDIKENGTSVLVATDGNGIFELNRDFVLGNHLFSHTNNEEFIESNNIYNLLVLNNGDFWAGTYDSGLAYLSSRETFFKNITRDKGLDRKLPLSTHATACYEDSEQNLWLGTNMGFLKMKGQDRVEFAIGYNDCMTLMHGSKILAIGEAGSGDIWIGTYDGGLGQFSGEGNHISTLYPFTKGIMNGQNINFIDQVSPDTLVINSMYKGLGVLDLKTHDFSKIPIVRASGDTLFNYQSQVIRQYENRIYSYEYNGDIYYLDSKDRVLRSFYRPESKLNDFSFDPDGSLWLATRGHGLVHINREGKPIRTYTNENGLSSNFLLRIEKDGEQNLWISSISGLSRLNRDNGIDTYDRNFGLPANEFSPFASALLQNGKLLFGTVKGFIEFDPLKKPEITDHSRVFISDITFRNTSIKKAGDSLLTQPLETTDRLKLPFKRNSFTIHFFNDSETPTKHHTFQYRMLGLQESWTTLDKIPQIAYTNMAPGEYTFQVKSVDKFNKSSSPPTNLSIIITPPWYQSTWAYITYFVLAVSGIYVLNRFLMYRARVKKELEISEIKIQAMKDLNEKKLEFFTNISHDFKTPLTMIAAPLERLMEQETNSGNTRENLNLIKRNTDRLYHLIIDLLDFRKINSDHNLKLVISKTDLTRFNEDIYSSFLEKCKQKCIDLSVVSHSEKPVYIDTEKLKRILWNLLSNAVKFTPEGGQVTLTVDVDSSLKITVFNSGEGLSEEELEHLFDRYQSRSDAENRHGTGLGLSIVKGLVDAHRGSLSVSSEPGKGTAFHLDIPCKKSDFNPEEIVSRSYGNYNYLTEGSVSYTDSNTPVTNTRNNLPAILVIEDDTDMNTFLVRELSAHFKVLSAFNGKEGFELAYRKNPDLVISDIKMPVMDGYTVCDKIKDTRATSHIPVILLTSKNSLDEQVKGMKHGADAYVTKPFKFEFLTATVNSIISNRKKLRKKFQGLDTLDDEQNTISPYDKEFIETLNGFIENNLSMQEISVKVLAEELNCSKTTLTRKTKALTGLTPMSYIRRYKLNIAYELIVRENLPVNDVSYKIGFSDPNYFSTCFKKQFGTSPSTVNKEVKEGF